MGQEFSKQLREGRPPKIPQHERPRILMIDNSNVQTESETEAESEPEKEYLYFTGEYVEKKKEVKQSPSPLIKLKYILGLKDDTPQNPKDPPKHIYRNPINIDGNPSCPLDEERIKEICQSTEAEQRSKLTSLRKILTKRSKETTIPEPKPIDPPSRCFEFPSWNKYANDRVVQANFRYQQEYKIKDFVPTHQASRTAIFMKN